MRTIFRVHRTLSCLLAPLMIFFAVSGAWQIYRRHDDTKDGSYRAPQIIKTLSRVHMAEKLAAPIKPVFRLFFAVCALLFAVTAIAGIVMALQVTKPRWLVGLWLALGVGLPALLALLAR